MSRTYVAAPIAFVLTAVVGCGSSGPVVKPTAPKSIADASPGALQQPANGKAAENAKANAAKSGEKPAKRQRPATEKGKVAQLFQVPEISRKNFPNPAANDANRGGPGSPPAIRLLGFSRVDGRLQALVELKGEVLAIEQGQVIDGAEVVAVDNESVSFQYSGQRWASRLFEKRDQEPAVTVARIPVEAKPSVAVQGAYEPPALSSANLGPAGPSGPVKQVDPAQQVTN